MPAHGELIVDYRIYSSKGPDIVLTRNEALALYYQLQQVLNLPAPKSGSKK